MALGSSAVALMRSGSCSDWASKQHTVKWQSTCPIWIEQNPASAIWAAYRRTLTHRVSRSCVNAIEPTLSCADGPSHARPQQRFCEYFPRQILVSSRRLWIIRLWLSEALAQVLHANERRASLVYRCRFSLRESGQKKPSPFEIGRDGLCVERNSSESKHISSRKTVLRWTQIAWSISHSFANRFLATCSRRLIVPIGASNESLIWFRLWPSR